MSKMFEAIERAFIDKSYADTAMEIKFGEFKDDDLKEYLRPLDIPLRNAFDEARVRAAKVTQEGNDVVFYLECFNLIFRNMKLATEGLRRVLKISSSVGSATQRIDEDNFKVSFGVSHVPLVSYQPFARKQA